MGQIKVGVLQYDADYCNANINEYIPLNYQDISADMPKDDNFNNNINMNINNNMNMNSNININKNMKMNMNKNYYTSVWKEFRTLRWYQ